MSLWESLYKENKRLCPRCYQEFYPGECDIVATIPPTPKGKEEVLKAAPKKGLKLHFARMDAEPLSGDFYAKRLATRKCPHCGYLLPRKIDTIPTKTIVIAGDVGCGKSTYIATLIKEIEKGYIQSAKNYARFICVTPAVEKEYEIDYFDRLYRQRQVLDATQPFSRTRPFPADPLIYELTISRPEQDFYPRSIYLVIHDAAGEDFEQPDRLARFTFYIFKADGIIFLADPAAMPGIANRIDRAKLDASGGALSYSHNSSHTLNIIASEIEGYKGVPPGGGFIDTPVAVTLSKSDLLELHPAIQGYDQLFTNPPYDGGVDLDDIAQTNADVRQIIEDVGDRTLLQAVDDTFSKARFLAVSATGSPPDKPGGQYTHINPYRCLDPLLWILYELECVPPKRI
jgi:GTPase SAR1 family protein